MGKLQSNAQAPRPAFDHHLRVQPEVVSNLLPMLWQELIHLHTSAHSLVKCQASSSALQQDIAGSCKGAGMQVLTLRPLWYSRKVGV